MSEEVERRKRSLHDEETATAGEQPAEESSDEDIGPTPAPSDAAPGAERAKKRRTLKYETLYLDLSLIHI